MPDRCGHCAECLEIVRTIYEKRNRSPSNTESSSPPDVSKIPTMPTLTPEEEADLIAKSEQHGITPNTFVRLHHADPVFNPDNLVGNLGGFFCLYCKQLPASDFSDEMAPEVLRLLKTQYRQIVSLPEPVAKKVLASFKTPFDALAFLVRHDRRSSFWRRTGLVDAKGARTQLASLPRALAVLYTLPRKPTPSAAADTARNSRMALVAEAQGVLAEAGDLLAEAKDVLKTGTVAGSDIDELIPRLEALIGRVVVETARVTARLDDDNGPVCPHLADIDKQIATGQRSAWPASYTILGDLMDASCPCPYLAAENALAMARLAKMEAEEAAREKCNEDENNDAAGEDDDSDSYVAVEHEIHEKE